MRTLVFGAVLAALVAGNAPAFAQSKARGKQAGAVKTYTNPGRPIDARVGGRFGIILESNPTTGYQWRIGKPLDAKILRNTASAYTPDSDAMGEQRTGAGGEELWTFEAVGPGSAEIVMEYARSWEKGIPPVKTAVYVADVRR